MQLTEGYKQTLVGVIPEDWEVNELNKYAELLSSKRIFEDDYVSVGIPFWRGSEVSALAKGKPISKEYFISTEKYETLKRSFGAPTKGDILVTAVGTLGNIYLVPNNAPFYFKDGNLIWLRNIKHIDNRYLKIQLLANKQQILDGAIGSSQKALTIVALKTLRIPLPPTKAEQEAIAKALSDTDAWIESLEQLITKKRRIKEGSMQALLTGKQRLPGFTGDWEVKRVQEFGDIVTGGTPSTSVSEYWNGEFPWITPTDINNQRDIFSSERKLTKSGLSVIRPIPANSVLITCIASIGKNTILKNPGGCNQQINAIIPNIHTNAEFIYYLFELNKSELMANAGTTATAMISKATFSEIKFSVPAVKEQTAIAEILSEMDAELDALAGKLSKARQIKQGMMQELLTGKTRLV